MSDLSDQAVQFGPYRIHPRQRLVLEAGRPLRLGRRAVEILLILLEQAGNVVSKQELIARVWPKALWKTATCGCTWLRCARHWPKEPNAS